MNVVLALVLAVVLLGQPGPAAVMYGFTDAGQFGTPVGDDPDSAEAESASDSLDELAGLVDRLEEPSVPPGIVVFTSRREGSVDGNDENGNDEERINENGIHKDRIDKGGNESETAVLDSEPRATLYEVVTGSPGISMTEVAERAGIPLSTARYHSRVLTNEDVIDEEKIRGKRRLFPAAMEPDRRELAAAMADDATASLLAVTFHLEPIGVCGLAEELDRSASTISYHLTRLEKADLLEREHDGDYTVVRLDPAVRSALGPDGATVDGDVPTLD